MAVFGTNLYGKCDRVPGLFHVATKFGHINFVPLIPLKSYLVLEIVPNDGTSQVAAIEIPFSFRSWFWAWTRVLLLFCSIGCLLALFEIGRMESWISASVIAGMIVGVGMWWYSYRIVHASYQRALQLGKLAGIDPEFLAQMLDAADPSNDQPMGSDLLAQQEWSRRTDDEWDRT